MNNSMSHVYARSISDFDKRKKEKKVTSNIRLQPDKCGFDQKLTLDCVPVLFSGNFSL